MVEDSRIVCCLETWVKEITIKNTSFDESPIEVDFDKLDFTKLDRCTHWIVSTYLNEIKDGDYVSDEEYKEWLLKREIQ